MTLQNVTKHFGATRETNAKGGMYAVRSIDLPVRYLSANLVRMHIQDTGSWIDLWAPPWNGDAKMSRAQRVRARNEVERGTPRERARASSIGTITKRIPPVT